MKDGIHRREFLRRASVFSLAATGIGSVAGLGNAAALAKLEPEPRMGESRLKISLNAYSFDKALDPRGPQDAERLRLVELAGLCAGWGFDGMDATGYYFPGYYDRKVPGDRVIFELKRRMHDLGLGVSGTGVSNCFTTSDKAARAKDVEWVKLWVEVAAKLGAPVLRIFPDTQQGPKTWQEASGGAKREEVEAWNAAHIRECAEHAAKFGVLIGVQNHGDFIKTADELISLLKLVDSPWCGAVLDTGSFKTADPYADIAKAAPYAVNWQIKQTPYGTAKDAQPAPADHMKRLIAIVRASKYSGYLPIETLAVDGDAGYDPTALAPKLLAEVREAIKQV